MFFLLLLNKFTAAQTDECYLHWMQPECEANQGCHWATTTIENGIQILSTENSCVARNFTYIAPTKSKSSCYQHQDKQSCVASKKCLFNRLEAAHSTTILCMKASDFISDECKADSETKCEDLSGCSWYSWKTRNTEGKSCLEDEQFQFGRQHGLCKKFDDDKQACNAQRMCDYSELTTSGGGPSVNFCGSVAAKFLDSYYDDGGKCEIHYDPDACGAAGCAWSITDTPVGKHSWCAAPYPEDDVEESDGSMAFFLGIIVLVIVVVVGVTAVILILKAKKSR